MLAGEAGQHAVSFEDFNIDIFLEVQNKRYGAVSFVGGFRNRGKISRVSPAALWLGQGCATFGDKAAPEKLNGITYKTKTIFAEYF